MIEVIGLTKKFKKTLAVDDLSFTAEPGHVTGFLGPNGAGKSTTMRMIVGLENPDAGASFINGVPYRELDDPLHHVGALLDVRCMHPKRTARNHLRYMASSNGIPDSRVDECLELVGLTDVAKKLTGGFSMGMRQRLGIAEAMLGDPEHLLFDEPVNGLDPEGIAWFRKFAKMLAAEGRTVLVSSHLLSEIALTADRLIVLGQGKLLADTSVEEFSAQAPSQVRIRTRFSKELLGVLRDAHIGATIAPLNPGDDPELGDVVLVDTDKTSIVADIAATHNIPLYELVKVGASVEDVYLQMTSGWAQYRSGDQYGAGDQPTPGQPPSQPTDPSQPAQSHNMGGVQ